MQFEGFDNHKGDDWDSNFQPVSTKQGELARPGTAASAADLGAQSFSESTHTPYGKGTK